MEEAKERIAKIIENPRDVERFARAEFIHKLTHNGTLAASIMVFATIAALIVANTDAYEPVHHILQGQVGFSILTFEAHFSVEAFVNDFLMAIFFLLVGIELKYEMFVGELSKPRQAALPMLAAVGGVVVPACLYLIFCSSHPEALTGWAIPMATDIAFALGVMSLLGKRVAPATKVFFSTLAIADDILAIVVIALFYGTTLKIGWLIAAVACVGILWFFNHIRVYRCFPYLIVGLLLWFTMLNSGIHATLAGVLLALFLPVHSTLRLDELDVWLKQKANKLSASYDENHEVLGQHEFMQTANTIENVVHHASPPLERVEKAINVPVNFLILPIFAFVNAQVRLVGLPLLQVMSSPITTSAFVSALVGKPLGIIGVTAFLVEIKFAKLPKGMDWHQVIGVGIMGGLGFTMSILIAGLAFDDATFILEAKLAILMGSICAALLGCLYLFLTSKHAAAKPDSIREGN